MELYWSPYIDEDDITVHVNSGVVTLNGTVDSWFERNLANQSAWEGGARHVINKLRVRNTDIRIWR